MDIKEPQTLDEFVRAIYMRQSNVIEDVKALKETVNGNGKPGLCQRVTVIETTLKVIGSVVVLLGGWIWAK